MGLLVSHSLTSSFSLSLTLPLSRSLALSNSLRLGICFTHLKERFVRQGDLTGQVVHPWFIWFMAVTGVHLHQESRHEWRELRIQRMLTQMLLCMLLKMKESGPPFDTFQAWYLMAMFSTYTHTIVPAQRYLLRCQELITFEDFRLVEPTGVDASTRSSPSSTTAADDRPPEYNDKKHEQVSVLVNLIYLQCIHCLLYDACHGMYADLEAQLPDFEVRLSNSHIPQSPFADHRLSAGPSGGFRSLLVRSQSPHHAFGSGHVSTSQAVGTRRFLTPSKTTVVSAYLRSRSLPERVVDRRIGPRFPTQRGPSIA